MVPCSACGTLTAISHLSVEGNGRGPQFMQKVLSLVGLLNRMLASLMLDCFIRDWSSMLAL